LRLCSRRRSRMMLAGTASSGGNGGLPLVAMSSSSCCPRVPKPREFWIYSSLVTPELSKSFAESVDVELVADGKGGFVERVNHENINRSRLRVDTRKWMADRLAPKKYGDRILTEQQQLDAQGNPITPSFTVNVAPCPESPPAPEAAASAKDTRH
jgi:hypothetical protein